MSSSTAKAIETRPANTIGVLEGRCSGRGTRPRDDDRGGRGCLGNGRLGVPGQVWELRFLPSFPSFPREIRIPRNVWENAWKSQTSFFQTSPAFQVEILTTTLLKCYKFQYFDETTGNRAKILPGQSGHVGADWSLFKASAEIVPTGAFLARFAPFSLAPVCRAPVWTSTIYTAVVLTHSKS